MKTIMASIVFAMSKPSVAKPKTACSPTGRRPCAYTTVATNFGPKWAIHIRSRSNLAESRPALAEFGPISAEVSG